MKATRVRQECALSPTLILIVTDGRNKWSRGGGGIQLFIKLEDHDFADDICLIRHEAQAKQDIGGGEYI